MNNHLPESLCRRLRSLDVGLHTRVWVKHDGKTGRDTVVTREEAEEINARPFNHLEVLRRETAEEVTVAGLVAEFVLADEPSSHLIPYLEAIAEEHSLLPR